MTRKIYKMKKNILSFLVLTVIMFSACAQQKKTTSKVSDKATNGVKNEVVKNNIQQIAMERTPCFGTCAAYRLEVNKDGKVTFISRHYTEYEGTYEKTFPTEKVAALFKKFSESKVDTCEEEYKSLIQDVPGIMYYITYDSKKQTIKNAHFGPGYLKSLAKEVDYFSKVDESWTKVSDKTEE